MGTQIAISIDGQEGFLYFKNGKDWKSFQFYQKSVLNFLKDTDTLADFRVKGKKLMEFPLPDERYQMWRLSHLQDLEYDFILEKEKIEGFIPLLPPLNSGSIEAILSQLQNCKSTAEILSALYSLIKDNVFDLNVFDEKAFLTYFSETLFGVHRKTVLFYAYQELLTKGFPQLIDSK
ncbi:MAG: hypothetical protein HQ474_10480 [Flammeovirgaceae bacterium]|jgi:hypothetical protein|nr:hypothetical protein [Flammeovirgaceae bacterium]|tara:strand:- start:5646 stop:6176 length:531 start_codon:yes stop_codon:yes gene_type:complete